MLIWLLDLNPSFRSWRLHHHHQQKRQSMESILARALEYTLKYWLKSFSRDQFKLHGRTVQLSNLGNFLIVINSGKFSVFLFLESNR